jgi:hypothetical protein
VERLAAQSCFAVALACALIACAPPRATASDLAAFLKRAEKMASNNRAVRADIEITHGDGPAQQAVLIIDPAAGRQLFAVRSSGWRSLLPLGWGKGEAVAGRGAKPKPYDVDEPLAGTDLRAMEFFPFWKTDYSLAFISDDSRLEKTVTLYAPHDVPYVLFVVTFDKAKLVAHLVKYFRDSTNNLVRLRTDSDYVMVGSRPRPQKIVIDDFTENSRTTIDLHWKVLDSVPKALMDEDTFDKATIDWPGPTIAANRAALARDRRGPRTAQAPAPRYDRASRATPRRIVDAATAAPNPLSMLTTVTPAAHEFIIASSAARPPKLAP